MTLTNESQMHHKWTMYLSNSCRQLSIWIWTRNNNIHQGPCTFQYDGRNYINQKPM